MEGADVDRLVMKPTARRRLGKYVLLGRLGAGGMGKIYLAHAPGPAGIEKLLVVKRLHSHLTNDPVLVNSFLDEARLSMALSHPNIGHTFDVGEVDGRYFMVMEYIDGQNLGVVLRAAKRSGKYPKSSVWAGLFVGVLDALYAAHTARDARGRPLQIIHRDVSPQNILLTYEGLPKLVDFGIAKAAMRVHETDAGTLKGKYAYMSPEQIHGHDLDARSDVFAAGIVLWEMLAGRRLYKADSIVRTVERIMQEPVISPLRVHPDCDPDIAKVALKALQKNRDERFKSAEEMRNALEDALQAGGHRYRPSDGKALMRDLFADVIDKQRAILEATLNHPVEDDGEGNDNEEDDKNSDDSQSDLRMPQLGVNIGSQSDSTTPSALRRSPLVTAEGDAAPPQQRALLTKPMVASRTPTPATASGRAVPPAARAATNDARVERHDELREAAALLAPPLTADEATATGVPVFAGERPRRRSVLVPIMAALMGVVLAVGVVAVLRSFDDNDHDDDQGLTISDDDDGTGTGTGTVVAGGDAAKRPPLSDGDDPSTIDGAAPGDDPDGAKLEMDIDGNDVVATPPDPAQVIANADDDTVDDTNDGANDGTNVEEDPADDVVQKTTRRVRRVRRPPPRPEVSEDVRDEVVAETGYLTLDTVPWTTVYLGKKKLGETPLVKVSVPAGNVELTLINSAEGVKEAYVARVKPGAIFRTRLDLR